MKVKQNKRNTTTKGIRRSRIPLRSPGPARLPPSPCPLRAQTWTSSSAATRRTTARRGRGVTAGWRRGRPEMLPMDTTPMLHRRHRPGGCQPEALSETPGAESQTYMWPHVGELASQPPLIALPGDWARVSPGSPDSAWRQLQRIQMQAPVPCPWISSLSKGAAGVHCNTWNRGPNRDWSGFPNCHVGSHSLLELIPAA